jgi:hypothetical protein
MNDGADFFFRWFPPVVAILQLVLLPLLLIALYSVIDARVALHNANPYAHPALIDLKELEKKIEALASTIQNLQLAVERMTPRRRTDAASDGGAG